MSKQSIYNIVIGTAGHIDHGKSSLVRMLTGIDPDRLPEEKERGLTIDIGFAPFTLKNGQKVGIIDVPGHERFIKNMVAGATGIDLVILVIAADDGIMPQTREHLQIMTLLGLKKGIIALNKIDLMEKDMAELVAEDIKDLVKGTFLETAPLCPISTVTGEGIDKLIDILNKAVIDTPPRSTGGIFRMPIQRVFSAKGFGTIVTGIPISGSAKIGDILEILPLGRKGRIRGLQAYKDTVDEIRAGHSSAINIADVNYAEVRRGFVVATPEYFSQSLFIEARIKYLQDTKRQIKNITYVKVHTGTSEVDGTMAILDKKTLSPGEEGIVQFRLSENIVVGEGDALIVRLQSPAWTIGGGSIISSSNKKLKRLKDEVVQALLEREKALKNTATFIEVCTKEFGDKLFTQRELAIKARLTNDAVTPILNDLRANSKIITSASGRFINISSLGTVVELLQKTLGRFHESNPLAIGIEKKVLREISKLDDEPFELSLSEILKRAVAVEENGRIRLASFSVQLTNQDVVLLQQIEKLLQEAKFQTPRREEIYEKVKNPKKVDKLLSLLTSQNKIAVLKDDIILHRTAIDEAKHIIIDIIKKNGAVEPSEFRDIIGTSRKYVIPLLEYFDDIGLTIRNGNKRILKDAR